MKPRSLLEKKHLWGKQLVRVHAGTGEAILRVTLLWEPRDLWSGVFWSSERVPVLYKQPRQFGGGYRPLWGSAIQTSVYVCLVWCFPLRFTWTKYGMRLPADG